MSYPIENGPENHLSDHTKDLSASTNLAIRSELRERVKDYYSETMHMI